MCAADTAPQVPFEHVVVGIAEHVPDSSPQHRHECTDPCVFAYPCPPYFCPCDCGNRQAAPERDGPSRTRPEIVQIGGAFDHQDAVASDSLCEIVHPAVEEGAIVAEIFYAGAKEH